MPFSVADALTLVQDLRSLLNEEAVILASSEDAGYFRTRTVRQSQTPSIVSTQNDGPRRQQGSIFEHTLSKIASSDVKKEPKTNSIQPVNSPSDQANQAPTNLTLQIPQNLKEDNGPKTNQPTAPEAACVQRPPSSRHDTCIRSILQKIAPDLPILERAPSDITAKQIAARWKTNNQSAPISILSSQEMPSHKALLMEIARALDVYFGPAKIIEADPIEKDNEWKTFLSIKTLKLIVVCDATLWQLQQLRQHYKETPANGLKALADTPVFLLPDLSLYLKDPLLKRSLWKALCAKCS